MRAIVHPDWVELYPESFLENETVKRWRDRRAVLASATTTSYASVPWHDGPLETARVRVDFRDPPVPAAAPPVPPADAPPPPSRLVFDPAVSDASPVVKGTWVTAAQVVSLVVDGWTWADVLAAHPELTEDDVRACLAYAVAEQEGSDGD